MSVGIKVENAYFRYKEQTLFENLKFNINPGQIACILGPSGVGKTSLLRLIANLGTNNQDEESHAIITDQNGNSIENKIAYLSQDDSLLPWYTAYTNAMLGAKLRGTATNIELCEQLFKKTGLESAKNKHPMQLSGGMRQRVALIRTILEDKPIILMDEPFASLDAITKYDLHEITCNLLKNKTVLLITHDPIEALRISDKIYILSGQPAKLHSLVELTSKTPRDTSEPSIINHHSDVFKALRIAKAKS